MQYDGAVCGPTHPPVGDAHHVAHAEFRERARDGDGPGLGHPRADRPYATQHEHMIRRESEPLVVDRRLELLKRVEDMRDALVHKQRCRRCGHLDHRAIRCQRAAKRRETAGGRDRVRGGPDHGLPWL